MPKKTPAHKTDNPTIQYSTLKLHDTEYKLLFNYAAIVAAEKLTGLNLMNGLMNVGYMTAGQVQGLLYAAMLKGQPDITFEQVGDLLTFDAIIPVQCALVDAFVASVPKPKELTSPNEVTPEVPAAQ